MKKIMKLSLCLLAMPAVGLAQWTVNTMPFPDVTHLSDVTHNVVIGQTTNAFNAKLEVNKGSVVFRSLNGGRVAFTNPAASEGFSLYSMQGMGIENNRADIRFNGTDLFLGCHQGTGPLGPVSSIDGIRLNVNGHASIGDNVGPSTYTRFHSEITQHITQATGLKGVSRPDYDQLQPTDATGVKDGAIGVHGLAVNVGTQNDRKAIGVFGEGIVNSEGGIAIGVYGVAGNTANQPNAWAIYADGNTYQLSGSGLWTSSDKRLKKNIENISSGLDLINQLQPKTYEYKDEGKFATVNFSKGKIFGFLAQDLEKVIPEMVTTAPINFYGHDDDKTNDFSEEYKAVSYQMLIPVLTQGIKEQQQEIVTLREELMNLKEKVTELTGATSLGNDVNVIGSELMQNTPNPFSISTEVPYRLAEGSTNAYIYITDLNGKLIKKYDIANGSTKGSINISADNLADGMYIYTLITNDHVVDSKRMIVAK